MKALLLMMQSQIIDGEVLIFVFCLDIQSQWPPLSPWIQQFFEVHGYIYRILSSTSLSSSTHLNFPLATTSVPFNDQESFKMGFQILTTLKFAHNLNMECFKPAVQKKFKKFELCFRKENLSGRERERAQRQSIRQRETQFKFFGEEIMASTHLSKQ